MNKQDIQERQEIAKLFNKYSNEAINHILEMAGWRESSLEKNIMHGVFGYWTDKMSN